MRLLWALGIVSTVAVATPLDPLDDPPADRDPPPPPVIVTLSTSGLGSEYDRVAGFSSDIFLTGASRLITYSASATAGDGNTLGRLEIVGMEEIECENPGTLPDPPPPEPHGLSQIASFRTVSSTRVLASNIESGVASMSLTFTRTMPGTASEKFGGECQSGEIELRRNLKVFARATTEGGQSRLTGTIAARYVSAFRVVTFNIHYGKRTADSACTAREDCATACPAQQDCEDTVANGALAAFIRERRPDILLLQEVDRLTPRSRPRCDLWNPGAPIDQAAVLASQLGMDFRDQVEVVGQEIWAGQATLSSIPLLPGAYHFGTSTCDENTGYTLGVTANLSGTRINFYNLHLQHNTSYDCTMSCPLEGYCHNTGREDVSCEQMLRKHQAHVLRDGMEAQHSADGLSYLFGGDLNAGVKPNPEDPGVPAFDESYCESFEDAERAYVFAAGWTAIDALLYPGRNLFDHIGCSVPTREWWQLLETRRSSLTCGENPSDHWPTSVTVRYVRHLAPPSE